MIKVSICICSKFPNPLLFTCIKNLYEIQINSQTEQSIKSVKKYIYEIHVMDSCSTDFVYYNEIADEFPDVKIHIIENKNYEYGAWKYMLDNYNSSDIFFCIQDSIIITKYIDLDILNNKTCYTFHHDSGYVWHQSIIELGIENLKNSNLNYVPIIDTHFRLAQHCCFILNKHILEDIFRHLTIPPINKAGSCVYERNFGIYFIDKSIDTIDLNNFMIKINGNRQ
jgi:hypothetical protein